jgi:flagellar motility protein MotE (MotC chaperone)
MPPDDITPIDEAAEKKRLADEKKNLKKDRKSQMQEVKARAKEIERQEKQLARDSDGDPKGGSVFAVTFVIIMIWLGILALLVRLDVGGFGSGVLRPLWGDVPVVNLILPPVSTPPIDGIDPDTGEVYYGYTNIREAVDYIRELELELERHQLLLAVNAEEVEELRAAVVRLQGFEDRQVEFQRIREEFYREVIYAENGPGPEGFRRYYEEIDPAAAEVLYRQAVQVTEASKEVQDFARAYSEMRPRDAAAIFEAMTDNLALVALILGTMNPNDRGTILGAMDADIAAQLTKIMEP